MKTRQLVPVGRALLALALSHAAIAAKASLPLIRIAKLEINPARLDSYRVALEQEAEASVRLEPGVLAIYAVAKKGAPSRLGFFEIYADQAAYDAHIASAHLQSYADARRNMITSKKLIETVPVQLSAEAAPG